MKAYKSISICLLFTLAMPRTSTELSLEEELTLTYDQKLRFDKFKDLVSARMPHDYMKEDLYLLRWLRVNDFNIPAAEKMIIENLVWRKENNMDTILEEDWSDFDNEYRIGMEGCDKEGRPILSTVVGEWDMRRAVVTGKSQRMMRYTIKLLEEGSVMVRRLLQAGQNVTNFIELMDMGDFNIVNHGCPKCLAIYAYRTQSYEKHYPLMVHRGITVNTPAYFHTVYQILRPLLSKYTRDMLSFYGRDKKEWGNTLRKELGAENLSKRYGGLKEDSVDVDDLRRDPSLYPCINIPKPDENEQDGDNVENKLKREVKTTNKSDQS